MSTDYVMHVKRCCDNKELAQFYCNEIKTILDSPYAKCLDSNIGSRSKITVKINSTNFDNIISEAKNKINSLYGEISEKKFMICKCKNKEIKQSLEEDIDYIKQDINEYFDVISSCNVILGYMYLVTENLIKKKVAAYEYNGKDLPKDEHGWKETIWIKDVYAEMEDFS